MGGRQDGDESKGDVTGQRIPIAIPHRRVRMGVDHIDDELYKGTDESQYQPSSPSCPQGAKHHRNEIEREKTKLIAREMINAGNNGYG
jgi:hypothetical protein